MNSNTNYNIYQISQQIQEERLHLYEQQAKQIANAYRKVEQIKPELPNHTKKPQKPQHEYKPTSNYAMKVKETLKQINATKAKQCKGIAKLNSEVSLPNKRNRQQQKLLNVGLSNLFSFVQHYQKQQLKKMWQSLVRHAHEEIERQNYFILNYRKYRIFRAWKDQIIFMQIQNKNNQEDTIPLQAQQLAVQFRTFTLLKKSFAEWKSYSKKEAKRKKYQKQLIKKQLAVKQSQKKSEPKTLIKQNHELQSKVRNFVGKLKEQIQNKDRLITIKENTEQSQLHNKPVNLQEIRAEQEEEDQIESQKIHQVHENEIVIKPPNFEENPKNNKQMTNQQLQKKRKQLEVKHRGRKQALQKLRKEKEQKKKEEEMQRKQLQQLMEAEEKRIKQEKYKEYLKSKKEQQEWQLREKQLEIKANNFNLYRLKKYYGWLQLLNAKKLKKQKTLALYQTILSILYRIKSKQFIENTQQISNQTIQLAYERVQKKYKKNLLRKSLLGLFTNRQAQKNRKQQLFIRHEVYQLKIFYSAWKRAIPSLRDENVQWQLPRKKRADHFYSLQLLHKGLQSLRMNKEQQQRDRIINQQKAKIKHKIRNMLQDQTQINYAQFL